MIVTGPVSKTRGVHVPIAPLGKTKLVQGGDTSSSIAKPHAGVDPRTVGIAPDLFRDSFEIVRASGIQSASAVATGVSKAPPSLSPPSAKPERRRSWLGRVFSRVGSALRGLATGIRDAVVGVVKNVAEAGKTLAQGIANLARGKWTTGLRQIALAAVKLVQTPVDAALMLGGRALSAVQTLVGLEPVGRKLDAGEIAMLRRIYGDSIDYGRVRIKEGEAGLFSLGGRPFTHGDTIYFPPGTRNDRVLVHEMAHVWQHQNGGTDYMSESLWAQVVGEGYDYRKVLERGEGWRDMNPEQQAQFLQEAFDSRYFDDPSSRRFVDRITGRDYTDVLRDALQDVRAGKGAP